MTAEREAIDKSISELRALIERAVRAEQLRHQLTGLANKAALDEAVRQAIEDGRQFWLAFVEIDRFKQVNDRFGYDLADAMLKAVGSTLEQSAPRSFANQALVFHAHGDEFYVLGSVVPSAFSESEIHARLDGIRLAISQVLLPTGKPAELMRCTVSVGWATSGPGLLRDHMLRVELAVAHAKSNGRDRVARYEESMQKAQRVSLRADCAEPSCSTTFAFDVPRSALLDDKIYCPNCGARIDRPVAPKHADEPVDIT